MCITRLRLMPFQCIDDHTVYCVRVKCSNFRFHEIKRSFHDYVQFSQTLQQHLPKNNNVPKLKKDNISKLLKSQAQKHMNRQSELDTFIKSLLTQVPPDIANSDFFMDFFSDSSIMLPQQYTPRKSSLKHTLSLRRSTFGSSTNSSSVSVLSRSTTVSISYLSLPFYQSQQSQKSLQQHQQRKQSTISCTSSLHSSVSSSDNEIDDEEDDVEEGEDKQDMIKLKIIYDAENIVIIRVPRSISWEELDTQVRQKFALLNIDLGEKMALRVTTCRNSTSSNYSTLTVDTPVTASVISAQEDLSLAMQMAWACVEKVTLRITL